MKNVFSILLLVIVALDIYAQENFKEPIPLSPNTSAFAKYGEHPVNLNTGMVNISVPLYTVQSGGITVPIQISYHASGIRVNDLASAIGLGWSLHAGGSIVRSVRGIEDEKGYSDYMSAEDIVLNENNVDVELEYYNLTEILAGREDNLRDTYFLNVNGLSAKFWIDQDGSFIIEDGSPLLISKNSGTTYFEVIDQQGFTYRFGTNFEGTSYIEQTDDTMDSPGEGIGRDVKTCWKLTEIVSPSKYDTVSFSYELASYTKPVDLGTESIAIQKGGGTTRNQSRSKVVVVDEYTLKQIDYQNGKVVFYSYLDRLDITGARRIGNIEIYGQQQLLRTILFDNDQYYNRPGPLPSLLGFWSDGRDDTKSLRLDGVLFRDKIGTGVEAYSFEYDPTVLPARNSFEQDHWGYYNGQSGNTGLIHEQLVFPPYPPISQNIVASTALLVGNANREPNEKLMQAGILKKITYPTGGYTEFEYEGHAWKSDEKEVSRKTKNATATAIGYPDQACAKGISTNCDPSTKIYDEVTFTPQSDKDYVFATISLAMMAIDNWDDLTCSDRKIILKRTDGEYETKVYFPNGSPPIEERSEQFTLMLKSGYEYKLIAQECGYGTPSPLYASPRSSATVSWEEEFNTDYYEIKHGSGLRVKTIKSFDQDHKLASAKRYVYGSNGLGRLITYPNSYVGSDIATSTRDVVKYVTATSMVEFGTNGGSPVEYDYVTEKQIDEFGVTNGYRKLTYEPIVSSHIYQNLFYEDCATKYDYEFTDQNGDKVVIQTMSGTIDEINNRTNDFSVDWGPEPGSLYNYYLKLTYQSTTYEFDYWDQFIAQVNEFATGDFQVAQIVSEFECPLSFGYPIGGLPTYPRFVYDHWAAGKLSKEEIFRRNSDGSFELIRKTENLYETVDEGVVMGLGLYARVEGPKGPALYFNNETTLVRYDDYLTTGIRQLKKQTITSIENGQSIVQVKDYYYDNPHHLLTKLETSTSTSGESVIQQFYYPDDVNEITNYPVDQLALASKFKDTGNRPRLGLQLQQETYLNTELLKTVRTEFSDNGSDMILPSRILTSSGINELISVASYDKYDSHGNPLQITSKNGITTSYIWGYNHSMVVARIENMKYDDAVANLSGQGGEDIQEKTGSELLSAFSALQSYATTQRAMVTLYTYLPGVGMTSQTDANGRITYFEYDDFGRLVLKKDHENHIIEKIDYHIAN